MKHQLLAIPFLVAVLKAGFVLQKEESEKCVLSLPSQTLTKKSGSSLKELHIGFGVWMRECGTCHERSFPQDVSSEAWHAATLRMAWNTNITKKEQDALLKYILAVNSKSPEFSKQLQKWAESSR
jgi:hypothetical protein